MIAYRHNKTGKRYLVLAAAIDATNSRDGTAVTIYCPDDDRNAIFVRETAEFEQKFTPIGPEEA